MGVQCAEAEGEMVRRIGKLVLWLVVAGVALFLVIQLVPYGRDHANPPVTQEVKWDSPRTRELAVRACFDCHSNQTTWPWYSNVAPLSWLIQHDVAEGRQQLNFSEWDKPHPNAAKAVEQVQTGRMPRWYYLPIHPSASLSASEKDELVQGLVASMRGK
jgi:Haem-binding domain